MTLLQVAILTAVIVVIAIVLYRNHLELVSQPAVSEDKLASHIRVEAFTIISSINNDRWMLNCPVLDVVVDCKLKEEPDEIGFVRYKQAGKSWIVVDPSSPVFQAVNDYYQSLPSPSE